jgi:SAM-dependent methyltransferase
MELHGAPSAEVDEAWYLAAYPDVKAAVDSGAMASAAVHYQHHGRAEGRFPNAVESERPLTEAERQSRVSELWSAAEQSAGWYWMAHPMVQQRLNVLASGDPRRDSYGQLAELLRERGTPMPIARAVSLGCGFGGLERDLAARGMITEIDAYDIAPGAIAAARRLAAEAGLPGLRYHVADLEREALPHGSVDVVFAHQSVHHVARLDELFAAVRHMLRPGGIFHLHEFVGPTRFQWTDAQIAGINAFLDRLPPRLRALPSGQPRPPQVRPTVAAMIAADPSEAIRSSEILPVLRRHFDILEIRELGGALLHLGLGEIAQNFNPDSAADRAILEAFFAAEDAAMQSGEVTSDFVVVTAVKPP